MSEKTHYRDFMNVIRKSPFGELEEHNKKVVECVGYVSEMLDLYLDKKYEEASKIAKDVGKAEYEADKIKGNLRQNLPKSIFMPVDRGDILEVIHQQDEVADFAQDVAELLTMRNSDVPDNLKQDIIEHFSEVKKTVQYLQNAITELKDLIESSFSKKDINSISEQIELVNEHEYKADIIEKKISRQLFTNVYDLETLSVIHLLKIIDRADQIANTAEATGNRIRSMLAR